MALLGNRGRFPLVIPDRNLPISRRGHGPAGGQRFQLHQFAAAVLAALEE